jgi:hypothetical protein
MSRSVALVDVNSQPACTASKLELAGRPLASWQMSGCLSIVVDQTAKHGVTLGLVTDRAFTILDTSTVQRSAIIVGLGALPRRLV